MQLASYANRGSGMQLASFTLPNQIEAQRSTRKGHAASVEPHSHPEAQRSGFGVERKNKGA